MASGGREREEQDGRRINNIGGAIVVILKRPVVEGVDNNSEYHHAYCGRVKSTCLRAGR